EIITVSGSTVQTDADLKESVVQVDGYGTTYLQAMWGGHRAIEDPRVRRGLSMGVDRDALADLSEGRQPGTSLIPNVVPGWSDEFAVPFDVDGARELLEEAGLLDDMPGVRIQYNFDEPWLEVLREVWIDALGIDVNIEILESGVHSDTRWEPHDDDSVMSFYAGTFSGLPTLNNWIYNIFGYDYVRQFSLSADDWAELQAVQNDDSLDGPELAARAGEILSTRSSDEAQEFAGLVDEAVSTLDETEREAKSVPTGNVRDDRAQTTRLTQSPQLRAVAADVEGVQPRPSPEGYYDKYLRASGDGRPGRERLRCIRHRSRRPSLPSVEGVDVHPVGVDQVDLAAGGDRQRLPAVLIVQDRHLAPGGDAEEDSTTDPVEAPVVLAVPQGRGAAPGGPGGRDAQVDHRGHLMRGDVVGEQIALIGDADQDRGLRPEAQGGDRLVARHRDDGRGALTGVEVELDQMTLGGGRDGRHPAIDGGAGVDDPVPVRDRADPLIFHDVSIHLVLAGLGVDDAQCPSQVPVLRDGGGREQVARVGHLEQPVLQMRGDE